MNFSSSSRRLRKALGPSSRWLRVLIVASVVVSGSVVSAADASATGTGGVQPVAWTTNVVLDPGSVTTLAGSGTSADVNGTGAGASFVGPYGITVAGNYAYEIEDGYIRRIDLASGAVGNVAGNGHSGCFDSSSPANASVDVADQIVNDGSYLYWADSSCGSPYYAVLRKMSLTTGAISLVPGSPRVAALTIAADGSLIIGYHDTISRVDPATGQSTVLATLPTLGAQGDYTQTVKSMAADSTALWVSASVSNGSSGPYGSVSKIDSNGAVTSVYDGVDHGGYNIAGQLVSAGIFLYAATNTQVIRFEKATGTHVVIAGSGSSGDLDGTGNEAWFGRIGSIDSDGSSLYVSDIDDHKVRKIGIGGGTVSRQPPAWSTTVGMSIGAVSTLAGSGSAETSDGAGTQAAFTGPNAISIANGYAFTIDNGYIRRITLSTGAVTSIAGNGRSGCHDGTAPSAIQVGVAKSIANDGRFLYWTDPECGGPYYSVLRRMSLSTGAVSQIPGSIHAGSVTIGTNGSVIVGNGDTITQVDPDTGDLTAITTLPSIQVGSGSYSQSVLSMVVDPDYLWVSTDLNDGVHGPYGALNKVDLHTGTDSVVYTSGGGPNVAGQLVNAHFFIYAANATQIVRVDKDTNLYDIVAGQPDGSSGYADGNGSQAAFGNIQGIDSDGTSLYVSDTGNHRLRKINVDLPPSATTTGVQGSYPNQGVGNLEAPGPGNVSEHCGCGQGQVTVYPVNTSTGAFWHEFDDLSTPGRGISMHVSRTYVSLNASHDSLFGHGWSSNYDLYLTHDPNTHAVTVHQEDGSQVAFVPDGAGGFNPIQPRILATLTESSSGQYTFTRARKLVFTFNPGGHLTAATDLNGEGVSLGYTQAGYLQTVTDNAGRQYTFTVDNGHVTKVSDPAGRNYKYTYSSAGDLTSVTDPTNAKWSFTYDGNHQMLTMLNPRQQSSSNPSPLQNVYDSSGRVTEQIDFASRTTLFDYTSIPNATKITDPVGNVSVDYYSNGLRTKTTTAYGTGDAATTQYFYDSTTDGITSVIDPLGHTSTYTFDDRGNMLSSTDPLGRKSTFTYDNLNDQLTSTDPANTTTTQTYDDHGNLLTVSTPLESSSGQVVATRKMTYHHDSVGHPGDVTSVDSPNGNTTHYTYDLYGNLTAVTAAGTAENSSGDKTTYTYDANTGWRTSVTTPRGNVAGATAADFTTTYSYDNAGRLIQSRDPLWVSSAPTQHQSTRTYDADGDLLTSTDAKANTTTYAYDADDELVTTTRPNGTSSHQTWTDAGQLATSTDFGGSTTTYTYDTSGDMTTSKDPLGHVTKYSYDSAGELILTAGPGATCSGTTPTAGCTAYTYDDAGQLTSRKYLDGNTHNVTGITYDVDGRLTSETDATGTTTTSYDNLGRVLSVQNGNGVTVAYGYDLDGNTTSIGYPGSGHTVTQSFDALDRMISTTDWASRTVTYGYDADSNPATTTFPSASSEVDTTTYNYAGAVNSITDRRGTTTLAVFSYTRNPNNLLTTATTSGITDPAQTYAHDAMGRLTVSGSSSTPTNYTYSAGDDITNRGTTSGAAASTQTFNAGHQLCWSSTTTVAHPACGTVPTGATTYAYDIDGNRTSSTTGSATTTYSYDEADQLTGFTSASGTHAQYGYDSSGLRQSKTIGTTTTQFTWDVANGLPSLLSDADNYYLYDNAGRPLEQIAISTGASVWLHHDQLGSTRLLTNTSGTTIGTVNYDPYGNRTTHTGTATTPLGYTGEYTDTESGLSYLRARYYDPTTAQFLSVDPLAASTHQPYSYSDDTPTDNTDPSGLDCHGFNGCGLSYLEAAANGATFGLPGHIDDAISSGSTCTYDHDNLGYKIIYGTTTAASFLYGGGEYRTAEEATDTIAAADTAGSADTIVLGHYPEYVDVAKATGGRTFQVPTKVWDAMAPEEQWAANQKFLDRAIARGSNVQLATPASAAREGSYFERELQYMQSKGYAVGPDGMSLIAPGG